jgi:DNA-binding response OmpR family regulator
MDVLIIEDNADISTNIAEYLNEKGHSADFAYNGITGLQLALENNYDAIVLDLVLPGMNGLTVCKRYQEQHTQTFAPILMLTAKDTVEDIVAGLSAGADDYLVKPFSLQVLVARLEVLQRRIFKDNKKILSTHDLSINLDTREVKRGNHTISLKPTTAKILELLIRNTHRVVPRKDIEKEIWGDNPPAGDSLRAHIYSIRKFVDKDSHIQLVHTIHGIGYRVANIIDESK